MFVLLLGINTMTMYNYGITALGYDPSTIAFTLQTLLVFTPLLYIVYIIYNWLKPQCCLCEKNTNQEQVRLVSDQRNEMTDSLCLARGMDLKYKDPGFTADDKNIPPPMIEILLVQQLEIIMSQFQGTTEIL